MIGFLKSGYFEVYKEEGSDNQFIQTSKVCSPVNFIHTFDKFISTDIGQLLNLEGKVIYQSPL